MLDNSQSFTLDDNERQQILCAVANDSLRQSPPTSQIINNGSQQRPSTGSSVRPDTGNARLFDHSYSQRFSQTQEDTSSFRQQIDDAPPVERDTYDIENIFDADLDSAEFRPLETSTAVGAGKTADEDFSPPSSIEDGNTSADESFPIEPLKTPAAGRRATLETPAGLTQMFQSSQETPVLQQRKSTYVTMKDSQQLRRPVSDDDDSMEEDDDPDFPRVRRTRSRAARDSAAHSVMQRLRDRTTLKSDGIDGPRYTSSRQQSVAPISNNPEEVFDHSTIPASAPIVASSQPEPIRLTNDGPDSIITDSQPAKGTQSAENKHGHTIPPEMHVPSSPQFDTVQSDLRSSLEATHNINAELSHIENPLARNDFPSSKVSTLTDSDQLVAGQLVSNNTTSNDQHVADDLTLSVDSPIPLDLPESGHKDKPILLKDTPMHNLSYSVDLTLTDSKIPDTKLLRRSASHSLTSSTTPIHTSIGTSIRSKSLYTPFQPPPLFQPEHTSPIIQAGDRRRSRKSNVVLESPLEHTPLQTRKRGLVLSSLGEDGHSMVHSIPTPMERPSKRQRVQAEIDDSQLLRQQSRLLDTPEQPPFNFHLLHRPVSIANGSEVSRSHADPDSDEHMASSPLTSLASEDFIQETSPHHLAKPGTTRWSKRVFALHRETDSYYPGDLVDCAAIIENFSEDIVVSIKFDDTEEADLALQYVRPLDLRVGDLVKLNITGIKTKQWSITSLHRDLKNGTLFTDIHGHTSFDARRKDTGQIATFPIDQIYLPASLFKPFQKRQFSLIQKLITKVEPETPSRRQMSRLRSTSPTLSMKGSQRDRPVGLFSGLAMSVTIAYSKTTSRDKIERKITLHGGVLLANGLDALFEDTPYSEDHDIAPLRLTAHGKSLKGAFVVADNPSRKAKYLQALSLGIPCLHYSFIDDCVAARKVLDASTYLLAAGEGRINESLVSMSMIPDLSMTSLTRALDCRRRLFRDKTMIVVTGPDRAHRKIHLFLSWAMGCADLTECATIEDAHHLLVKPEDGKRWDYVNVQDLDGASHAVREVLHDLKGRVVTNEDVVQSLITGRLCITY